MHLVFTHVCGFFLHLVGVRENDQPIFSLFHPRRFYCIACRLYATDIIYGDARKAVSDFGGSIRSCELTNHVRNKRTNFASFVCTFESSRLVVRLKCVPN